MPNRGPCSYHALSIARRAHAAFSKRITVGIEMGAVTSPAEAWVHTPQSELVDCRIDHTAIIRYAPTLPLALAPCTTRIDNDFLKVSCVPHVNLTQLGCRYVVNFPRRCLSLTYIVPSFVGREPVAAPALYLKDVVLWLNPGEVRGRHGEAE